MRGQILAGAALLLSGVWGTTPAHADSPPMPPCPAGWQQVDAFTCREPFHCPPGWKLDTGPVCVPWECQKAADCSWKGHIACREADVCVGATGGRAVRVCDSGGGGAGCPSGLTCQKRKLCANFPGARQGEAFGNWTPGAGGATSAAATVASPPPPAMGAATSSAPAASATAASAPAASAPADVPPAAAPARRGGCEVGGTPSRGAAPHGFAGLLLALYAVARRRSGAGAAGSQA